MSRDEREWTRYGTGCLWAIVLRDAPCEVFSQAMGITRRDAWAHWQASMLGSHADHLERKRWKAIKVFVTPAESSKLTADGCGTAEEGGAA